MAYAAEANIPMSKRAKTLDAETTRNVRQQHVESERFHKACRTRHREVFTKAKALIMTLSDKRLSQLGKPHGLTIAGARKQLISAARLNPERTLRAMSREA